MKNIAIVFFVMLFFSACDNVVINRGYEIASNNFEAICVGKDSAMNVFNKYGSPTVRSSVESVAGEYTWYYTYKQFVKKGFLSPKVVKTQIIAITFNANNIVVSVLSCKDSEQKIAVVDDKTKTLGKKYKTLHMLKDSDIYISSNSGKAKVNNW